MPTVPLGVSANARLGMPAVKLRNFYLEKDRSGISPDGTLRIQRPGLVPFRQLPSAIRGMMYYSTALQPLFVAGERLYADQIDVGMVGGLGPVRMSETNFFATIVSGINLYLYNGSVIPVTMPDGRPVQDADQLNSYVIILCPDGRFYWLRPGETVVDPLNYATAETSPDGGVALVRVGDEFLILGPKSGEWWQSTGDDDQPWLRVSGRPVERGCLSRDTVQRFDNSVIWVTDDLNVVRWDGTPRIISDEALSEAIRLRDGPPSAWVSSCDGHRFYNLRIPGQGTWVFDAATSQWSTYDSPGHSYWLPASGYEYQGQTFAGSSDSGDVWEVTASAFNDAGVPFERIVTGTVPIRGAPPRNSSFSVGANFSEDGVIRFRWKDGQEDYPNYYDELDVRAAFDVASIYRLGAPDEPYRTFEVSVTDDLRAIIYGAMANDSWG